ncbi:voltage-dependent calcium channel type A subunit alpha-1-like protein [Leptotrombidium deliense]|uniref:Voltage-dependent calcium channel type A subunit alpha-1-like protein n=1 Tax=Leptotrombidium deliense TaxID=299467 RepID=A0A443SQX0_9ACAR|nr:voltage-dependent calcium channel type A subunit alpha-1-like protein [Leptotrombidium deliense]
MEFGEETSEPDLGDENYTAEKSDKIVEEILSTWNFGGDWAENRFPYEKRAAYSYADGLIIEDIDISENNTCILVTKSLFGSTAFHRIPTNRSLCAFEISSGFRQFCMRLYYSRHYKLIRFLITLLQVVLTVYKHDVAALWFLLFFIADSVLASISRGLICHKQAYLRDYWNILDFGITLFELFKILSVLDLIYSFLYGIDIATVHNNVHDSGIGAPRLATNPEDKVYNFDLGLTRFARSLRFFRLMYTVKNLPFLLEFRLILRVFLSLFPKIFLLSILIVLILVIASIIFQTGYLGFIFCAITCLFGFFILSLILALIYDSYNEEIKRTPDVNNIHYFDGENEFPFDLETIETCEYNTLSEVSKKIDNKEFLHRYVTIARNDLPKNNYVEEDENGRFEEASRHSKSSLIDEFSEILRDMVSTRLMSAVINASIICQFLVLLNYRFYNERDRKNVLNSILETAETLISLNFVIEMMVKLIAFRLHFFNKFWNVFDLFVVLCSFINELDKIGVPVLPFLKYFRALRMFHFLMDLWSTMRSIVGLFAKCFKIVVTTFVVFCAIFIYFCIISYLLFETFRGSIDELDLLDISLGFDDVRKVIRTVFLMVVPSAWQEILQQLDYYLQRDPKTDEIIREPSYVQLIPYSFYVFIFFGYLFHLIFTDILIPQFFNELKVEHLEDAEVENQQNLNETWKSRKQKSILNFRKINVSTGDQQLNNIMKTGAFRYPMLILLWINLIIFDNPNQPKIYLLILLHVIFLLEFLLRIRAVGIHFIFYDEKTETYAWNSTIFVIDLVTISASIFDLTMRYFSNYNYTGSFYVSILVSLSCLRMIRHTDRLQLWFQILITNWKRMLNVILFCLFILSMYAIAGIQLFGGKLYFCEVTRGGGYSVRTSRRYLSDGTVWFACVEINSSISSKEDLSFTTERVYPFNFDDIFTGILTTLQMIYGDEIYETIGAFTSLSNLETGPQRNEFRNAWFFIVPVTLTGIVLDTLVFAVVSSNFDAKSQPEDSVWRLCKDESRLNTLLALDCIRRVKPWNTMFVPNETLSNVVYQLLNSKLYEYRLVIVN